MREVVAVDVVFDDDLPVRLDLGSRSAVTQANATIMQTMSGIIRFCLRPVISGSLSSASLEPCHPNSVPEVGRPECDRRQIRLIYSRC